MAKSILKKIESYSTVIWDWNGTLINDRDIAAAAEAELFKRHGLKPQTLEERIKNFSFPIEKYYARMGFDFSKVPYAELAEQWLELYEGLILQTPLFNGVKEMLEALSKAGRRQFVLSAAPEDHLHIMLKRHSIASHFEAVYGLKDAKAESKVARGHELVKDFSIDVKSAILVGDTAHDHEVAEALGCDLLLVADGHHTYETLLKAHKNVLKTRF